MGLGVRGLFIFWGLGVGLDEKGGFLVESVDGDLFVGCG